MITLKTLRQASAQQVYDQVKEHLMKQNAKSIRGDTCAYRGNDGLKCAAGCLISDEEYEGIRECQDWTTQLLYNRVPNAHRKLISALQRVHDRRPVDEWRAWLDKTASDFGLRS